MSGFLDTIDWEKLLSDTTLCSDDKVVYLAIVLKRNRNLKKIVGINYSDLSKEINIPKRKIVKSIENLKEKYLKTYSLKLIK